MQQRKDGRRSPNVGQILRLFGEKVVGKKLVETRLDLQVCRLPTAAGGLSSPSLQPLRGPKGAMLQIDKLYLL